MVGLGLTHVVLRHRQPAIVLLAATIAAYFLLGELVTSTSLRGIVPTPAGLRRLAEDAVFGWKELLTTLPPVASTGRFLALPFAIGLILGALGGWIAGRTRLALPPLVAPMAALAATILLGTHRASHAVAQGAIFALAALAWAAIRSGRRRPPVSNGVGRTSRMVTATALLGFSAVAGGLIAPSWPGAAVNEPVLLRDHVVPPFDIGQYPSPLAGFRAYTKPAPQSLWQQPLFRVSGLAKGTLLRVATLDDYTGTVWTACSPFRGAMCAPSDTFQRVGDTISEPDRGQEVHATVTILPGYTGVWLPDVGKLTGVSFEGPDAAMDGAGFRYNTMTGTGVVPATLVAGDRYSFSAVLPRTSILTRSAPVSQTGTIPEGESSFLASEAQHWSGRSPNLTSRVFDLVDWFKIHGSYTNGGKGFEEYLPGHSVWRLQAFVGGQVIAGDDEQYAAALALMINQVGVPARVVLGAVLQGSTVYGRNMHAWVEVNSAAGDWRAIPTSAFLPRGEPPKPKPLRQHAVTGRVVPPPNPSQPKGPAEAANKTRPHGLTRTSHAATPGLRVPGILWRILALAGIPLLILALLVGTIVGWKARRRIRRRSRGTPSARCAGGWFELIDHARDLGFRISARQTRREQAAVFDREEVYWLAVRADRHVFGPGDPSPDEVLGYWRDVNRTRRTLSREAGVLRRLRAALSLATFRPAPTTEASS
jgi:transglutaminase-like putative cysteine protease